MILSDINRSFINIINTEASSKNLNNKKNIKKHNETALVSLENLGNISNLKYWKDLNKDNNSLEDPQKQQNFQKFTETASKPMYIEKFEKGQNCLKNFTEKRKPPPYANFKNNKFNSRNGDGEEENAVLNNGFSSNPGNYMDYNTHFKRKK
jgi:hypothetical protein